MNVAYIHSHSMKNGVMRKSFTLLFFALLIVSGGWAQQVRPLPCAHIYRDHQPTARHSNGLPVRKITAASCGPDTLAYGLNKSTSLAALNVNGSTSAAALGQYYDCPQAITLTKIRFYAYKLNATAGTSVNVSVELYNAGPDSLPLGAALRTQVVAVDTNFYGGTLSGLQKVATFSSPITLTAPYVVVVRCNPANGIGLVINSYTAADGAGEWLGHAQISGNWLHGYDVNVAGTPFNCDILIDPVVSYSLRANFTVNPNCITSAGTATFTNTSSPILRNRMYSLAEFLHIGGIGVTWDFGDGSPAVTQSTNYDTTHFYATTGNFSVQLIDSMIGWTMICGADTTITMGAAPQAQYASTANNLTVNFTDQSSSSPTSWFWTFGDGQTSTAQNPQHTYAIGGTYQVCLTATSPCGSDSVCHSVTANCFVPSTAFSSNPNNLAVAFTDQTTGNGVNTWMWTFGDGGSSLSQNPSHTYTAPGTYLVCLTTSNACGNDSACHNVTVSCASPVAAFSQNGTTLTVGFQDQSTGSGLTWTWNFGDGSTSTQQNPTHTFPGPGSYTVCLTTTNACGADTVCDTVTVPLVGIMNALAENISLYPNPASSVVKIQLDLASLQNVAFEVCDLRGAKLSVVSLGLVKNSNYELPVGNLANGTYWLRFVTDSGTVVKRLNVMR
jgi:PKD repeat protein